MKTTRTSGAIFAMLLAGVGAAVYAGLNSHSLHPYQSSAILAIAALTSRMKVKLPRLDGNMSVNLPFLLLAVANLSALEAVLIAGICTVVQCWPRFASVFRPEQTLFNVSMMAFATSLALLTCKAPWLRNADWASPPLILTLVTAVLFLGQTLPVAGMIHLTQGTAIWPVWTSIALLSFPYFVLSAGVTLALELMSLHFGWQAALLSLPVMYAIYRSYRLYFGRSHFGGLDFGRLDPGRLDLSKEAQSAQMPLIARPAKAGH